MTWKNIPPTIQEWEASKYGMWWIRYILVPAHTDTNEETGEDEHWPEVWQTEVVTLTASWGNGLPGDGDGELYAYSTTGSFKVSDQVNNMDMYWQPVRDPKDDCDGRPNG